MVKGSENPKVGRFGGPGSSHQDREHPGKNKSAAGHKEAARPQPAPSAPTSGEGSQVSGGGGERDVHHTHTPRRS